MSARTGSCGDRSCDGWVEWSTRDDEWSYLPTLACGSFLVVVGRGPEWDAKSDDHGHAWIVDLAEPPYHHVEHPTGEDFVWSLVPFVAAVDRIGERTEHPNREALVEAARDLWFALFQESTQP